MSSHDLVVTLDSRHATRSRRKHRPAV